MTFPPNALQAEVTVRIARDGTGAPPLPAVAAAAGAVYTITPHGGGFAAHAEVTIPVEHGPLAETEQLLLLTASPGDTGWRALSGASYSNGAMRAPVAHFSFFQVVVIRDIQVPKLYVSVDNRNNEGSDGMTAMSPNFEFGTSSLRFVAKLRYARPPINVNILPTPKPTNCAPVSYGVAGAKWYFERNGSEPITPDIQHRNLRNPVIDSAVYPRTESEFNPYRDTEGGSFDAKPGFGAIHFYAQSNPRRGSYIDNVALPPANNVIDDDVLTWRGDATMEPTAHNGRHRVDVWVPTVCGFSIEAVPLLYSVNLPGTGRFGFQGLNSSGDVEAAAGARATMYFEMLGGNPLDPATLRWEFSTDRLNWQARPLPAGVGVDYPVAFNYLRGQLVVNAARVDQTGFYRAYACNYSSEGSTPTCVGGDPVALTVVTAAPSFAQQPQGSVVQVGETASFSAVPAGAPAPALQWQKRSIVAAAFNYTDWTNIAGASSNTLTLPAVGTADGATQFRVVATNELAVVASDAALLTVVDQFVPPAMTSQPGNLNVVVGGTAVFAGAATGSAPLSYQWLKNGVAITGANTPALTLATVAAGDAARYELVVSNRAGSVRSEPAALVVTLGTPVPLAPTIAAPPAPVGVVTGQSAHFAVAVNGTGPYTYLWSKDGVQIPGADSASFGIVAATLADAGDYTVRVTNNVGTVLSAAARLSVTTATTGTPPPPVITTQPASLAVLPGGSATLAVGYTGSGPFTFQWRRDGVDITGASDAVLNLASVNALDAGQYAVTVRNAAGVVDSNAARLVVIGAPLISRQPAAATAVEGASTVLSVGATGDNLRFLWLRNGIPVVGANTATLTTPALTVADSGAVYSVIVFNGAGAVVSGQAVLTVTAAAPAGALTAVQIVAHADRSLVLRSDGSVVAFGMYTDPLTGGYPNTSLPARPVVVAGLPATRQVAIGTTYSSWALGTDGSVWGWGFINSVKGFGQGMANTQVSFASPVRVLMAAGTPIDRVCQIVGAAYGVVMVRSDVVGGTCAADEARSVWFTGDSISSNEVGGFYATRFDRLASDGLAGGLPRGRWIVDVFTSKDFSSNTSTVFARANDGTVYAWGWNAQGQLGTGDTVSRTVPTIVAGWQGATRIAATAEATLAMMADGSVKGSGSNSGATLGIGSMATSVTTPTTLPAPAGASDLSAASGQPGAMALVGGQLRYWGSNNRFANATQLTPLAITAPVAFTALSVAGLHALAIGPGGAVYAWGNWLARGCGNFDNTACNDIQLPSLVLMP